MESLISAQHRNTPQARERHLNQINQQFEQAKKEYQRKVIELIHLRQELETLSQRVTDKQRLLVAIDLAKIGLQGIESSARNNQKNRTTTATLSKRHAKRIII